jgi:hypothetical protein
MWKRFDKTKSIYNIKLNSTPISSFFSKPSYFIFEINLKQVYLLEKFLRISFNKLFFF